MSSWDNLDIRLKSVMLEKTNHRSQRCRLKSQFLLRIQQRKIEKIFFNQLSFTIVKGNLVCCCASNQPCKLPLRLSSFYWKLLQTTTPSIHNKEAFFNYSRRKNYNWKLIGEWHHLYRLLWKSKNLHEGRENNREWNFPLIILTIARPWFPQNPG